MGHDVGYVVWTPADYDASGKTRYPVIYFLHGMDGNEASDSAGFSSQIAQGIRDGSVPPVICVFPNGGRSGYRGTVEKMIVDELIPLIDKSYPTKVEAKSRVVAGFSMGGAGAVRLSVMHPDLFCAAGSWGGGMWRDADAILAAAESGSATLRQNAYAALLINGDKDRPDAFDRLAHVFSELKIPHEVVVLKDTPHNLRLYYQRAGKTMTQFLGKHLQDLRVTISTIAEGDAEWDWMQARTAYVQTESPHFLTTMTRTAKVGSHRYHDVFLSISRDHGVTWSTPEIVPTLRRIRQPDGYEVVAGDLWPTWHRATGNILITGKTFNFENGTKENILREKISYAVINPATGECGPLRTVDMPERDHEDKPFIAPNAGCHQRVDLPNDDILLPIRYQKNEKKRNYTTIVARCRFDGETLAYAEHGSEHSIPTKRGLYEPSITRFGDAFLLTMRADDGAFVAKSPDGLHYSDHKPWTFDDGTPLGSYNTQQHWLTVGGNLYLVYTRRGADNDHIFRHRAPLFVAQVDPARLHVIRSTEQILVPENHATLGNSGVCRISDNESWITVAEGRVSYGKRKGENNRVILARVHAQ